MEKNPSNKTTKTSSKKTSAAVKKAEPKTTVTKTQAVPEKKSVKKTVTKKKTKKQLTPKAEIAQLNRELVKLNARCSVINARIEQLTVKETPTVPSFVESVMPDYPTSSSFLDNAVAVKY